MTHILVIWTIVAASGSSHYNKTQDWDWRPIGDFGSERACIEGARQLGYPADSKQFRCLVKQ